MGLLPLELSPVLAWVTGEGRRGGTYAGMGFNPLYLSEQPPLESWYSVRMGDLLIITEFLDYLAFVVSPFLSSSSEG